jgi:diguanylate cyclase (GGDEF)-like protein/PAS domain S-box-containing protein
VTRAPSDHGAGGEPRLGGPGGPDASAGAGFLRRVLDASRSATAVVGLDGIVRYASAGIEELLGAPLTGESVFDWLHPEDVDRAAVSLATSDEVRSIRYFPMVFRARHRDGHHIEVDVLAANVLDDPVLDGIVLSIRSADDRSQFIEPVRALAGGASHEQVLELIASGVGRGGFVLRPAFIASERDGTGALRSLVPVRSWPELTSLVGDLVADPDRNPWVGLDVRELSAVHADELPPAVAEELRRRGCSGLRAGAIGVDGSVEALLISAEADEVWHDGTWPPSTQDHWHQLLDLASVAFERHQDRIRLVHAATHDGLTGLTNRSHFFDQLERLVTRTDVTVLYLDLDHFKAVNDRRGHAVGDAVLVEVAHRLRQTVRPGDLVARLGGDEFAVAVADAGADLALALAHRLIDAVTAPIGLPGHDGPEERVGLSVGLAHHVPGQSADDLVHSADRALLGAKRDARGTVATAG